MPYELDMKFQTQTLNTCILIEQNQDLMVFTHEVK
jgi:hypothetical protein